MYKKFLIIASKIDPAGVNIAKNLSQFRPNPVMAGMKKDGVSFDFYLRDEIIISDENLDHRKISQYDFVIFISKHQSAKKERSLSVHAPGNWRNADYGGEKGKVCKSSAQFQKQLFEKLNSIAKLHRLKDYQITLECTHHGPLISKPCVFIEIGSTENEWKDRKAGFVVAKTVADTIKDFAINPYNEVAIGIGGPHYCPNFNKIQLNTNIAISHIIPLYSLPLSEEMVQEAVEKTQEELDLILLDWKGLGNSEQRKQVTDVLDTLKLYYRRTGEFTSQ